LRLRESGADRSIRSTFDPQIQPLPIPAAFSE
jgi:hypothetical protein